MALVRIQNEQELEMMVDIGKLVALPNDETLRIAPSLPYNRRYVLPQVISFLGQLSSDFYAQFGKSLVVDSAVRPRSFQERLRRYNRAAAPADGECASSHETGATIDLSKKMTKAQLNWLRWRLCYYQLIGWTITEDESQCLHIFVEKGI